MQGHKNYFEICVRIGIICEIFRICYNRYLYCDDLKSFWAVLIVFKKIFTSQQQDVTKRDNVSKSN